MPTDLDLAYAAGILDGEGYISIRRSKAGWNGFVGVNNTDYRLLFWLKEHFGGYVHRKGAQAKPHHKMLGMWMLQSKASEDFLRAVRPYLVLKGERADIYLAFRQTIGVRGRRLPADLVHENREGFRQRLRVLNQRGMRAS